MQSRRDPLLTRRLRRQASIVLGVGALGCALLGSCGGSSRAQPSAPHAALMQERSNAVPTPSSAVSATASRLLDWPEFGLNPQRSDATEQPTGITAANVGHLKRIEVKLPGTVDSSPIYLHDVTIAGVQRAAIIVTTTYGKTLALDASSGAILWSFTPHGYSSFAGSAQITTATPIVDPNGQFVYAASPNGEIHKLSLATGKEAGAAWPVSITKDPTHEKIASALNIDGPYLIATTGGYIGDIPPYQGHVVLIERSSGRIAAIFNTLCANRRKLIVPSSCPASDSAILSRAGAIVEPGGRALLIDTGNGPWNGRTNFGDSVLELTVPGLRLRQEYTPPNQEQLNTSDTDLGSSGPALLGHDRIALTGKDGVLRVLSLSKMNGHPPSSAERPLPRLGGAVQTQPLAGGGELFTAPAVWAKGAQTTVFIGAENSTDAYVLKHGRLHLAWRSPLPGTSPILAGGLLYVYDPVQGGIEVYRPASPHPLARLVGSSGHWNSPIVVDGHVIEPEGDANDHALTGTLQIFSAP
jgi:outer membrane protein assembly factor BamB